MQSYLPTPMQGQALFFKKNFYLPIDYFEIV